MDPSEEVKLPTRRKVNRFEFFEMRTVQTFLEVVQGA
jgi:hypothetical protein